MEIDGAMQVPPLISSRSQHVDARQHDRTPLQTDVWLQDGDGERLSGIDISAGGICLIGNRQLLAGQAVEVVLLSGNVRVRGTVRFAERTELGEWRVGIQFEHPQPELIAVISTLPVLLR